RAPPLRRLPRPGRRADAGARRAREAARARRRSSRGRGTRPDGRTARPAHGRARSTPARAEPPEQSRTAAARRPSPCPPPGRPPPPCTRARRPPPRAGRGGRRSTLPSRLHPLRQFAVEPCVELRPFVFRQPAERRAHVLLHGHASPRGEVLQRRVPG